MQRQSAPVERWSGGAVSGDQVTVMAGAGPGAHVVADWPALVRLGDHRIAVHRTTQSTATTT